MLDKLFSPKLHGRILSGQTSYITELSKTENTNTSLFQLKCLSVLLLVETSDFIVLLLGIK